MAKKLRIATTALIASLLLSPGVQAQHDSTTAKTARKIPLVLEYTFLDMPYAIYAGKTVNCTVANPNADVNLFKGMQYQSMNQANQISTGIMQSMRWGITQIPWFKDRPKAKTVMNNLVAGMVDGIGVAINGIPYTSGWAHEEYHRNVMVTHYTNSFNPLTLNKREGTVGNGVASVAFILDTNLVLIKNNDNPSFVRLSAAGGEGQIVGITRLQQQNFFYHQNLPNSIGYLLDILNIQSYIATCGNKDELTLVTEQQNKENGSNQQVRDFTGMDFAAWAYDLWHPNEPYAARGLHPYGNGYDRYISGKDLTDEQLAWLRKQSGLVALNFVSPMNFFYHSITLKKYSDGSSMRGNFSLRYYPTSFGNSIGLDLLLSTPKYNIFVSPHINQNLSHTFGGVEAMIFEYPVKLAGQQFLATVDVIADIQPKDQSFFTAKAAFTCYANASVRWQATKILYPYIGISGKNKGWIRGNPFLKEQFGCEVGLSARFNYTPGNG